MRKSVLAVSGRTMRMMGAMLIPGLALLLALIPAAVVNLAIPATASAAIEQRGTPTTGTTTDESLIIGRPTGVAAGDVMIVSIAKVGNSTFAPSLDGWILIHGTDLGGGSRYGAVLYRVADGTEGENFTFALGTGTSGAVGTIVVFSGVDTSGATPFDVTPGAIRVSPTPSSSVEATAVATTSTDAAVIMFGMVAGSAPEWSDWATGSPGLLTELYDNQIIGASEASVGAAWAMKSTAGDTGLGKAMLSLVGRNGGILLVLKPAVSTTLNVTQAIGTYGGTVYLTAALSPAMPGKTIRFTLNGNDAGAAFTDSTGTASIPAASLSGIDAGSYPSGVRATFAGDSLYGSSGDVAGLTVKQRDLRVTAHELDKVYGNPDPALTYEITSGSLAPGDTLSGSLTREAGEDVGTYAIRRGTLALDSNYNLTFVSGTLAINVRDITVEADDTGKAYGDDDPALTHQITLGFLSEGDAFSGKPEREAGEDLGTYAIRQGTLALNSNYDLTFVEGIFTISLEGPSTPTVSGISPQSGQPGDTLDVVISGSRLSGAAALDFGPGVTVNTFDVESPTRIVANITIDPDAEVGDIDIVITMPSGEVHLPGAFSIEVSGGAARGNGLWLLLVVAMLVAGLGFLLFWWFRGRRKRGDLELAPAPVPNRPSGGAQEAVDLKMAPAAAPVRAFQETEIAADVEQAAATVTDQSSEAAAGAADPPGEATAAAEMEQAPAMAAEQTPEASTEVAKVSPVAAGDQPSQVTEIATEPEVVPVAAADQPSEVTGNVEKPEEVPMAALSESPGETEVTADVESSPMAATASELAGETGKTAEVPQAAAMAAAPVRPRRRTKTKAAGSEQAPVGEEEPPKRAQRRVRASSESHPRAPTKKRKKAAV